MRWLPILALALVVPMLPSRAEDAPKGRIVYARKDGERYVLHVMNADGTNDKELPGQTANVNIFPSWSPDGKRIAYTAGSKIEFEDFQVVVMSSDGTGQHTINTGTRLAAFPAWSPDGKKLALTAGDQQPNVYVADADGNGLQQVNEAGSAAICSFWSRDSKSLGFTVFGKGEMTSDIVMKTLEGGAVDKVTSVEQFALVGAHGLSRDGKRLVYSVLDRAAGVVTFRIWDFAAKSEAVIDEVKADVAKRVEAFSSPGWSPDGKSLLVSMPTDKGLAVFRMGDDGKNRTRLTPEGMDCITPTWWAD